VKLISRNLCRARIIGRIALYVRAVFAESLMCFVDGNGYNSGLNYIRRDQKTTIRTIVQDRRIEIPAPDDLADGTEVVIELTPASEKAELDDDWDDSPEGIERWIQAVNSLQPLIFSEDELVALEADRLARKQWEKDHFFEYSDKLAKLWE